MALIVVISDQHLEDGVAEHHSYSIVKEFIKEVQPAHIVINGDMLDFSYLGGFNEQKEALREGKRLKADMDLLNDELDFLQANSSGVSYLEGNHEHRLAIATQKNPNILKDLIDLPGLARLKERNIKWYPEASQPVRVFEDLYIIHGKRYNIHFAAKALADYSTSIIQGHTHRLQTFAKSFLNQQNIAGYGLGCLCSTNPDYTNGYPTGHTNGFGIIETDYEHWTFHNVLINNGFFWNGKYYQ
ncbi:MAG: metallophosphoesterase [Candidatus Thorarchaeota archaeon]